MQLSATPGVARCSPRECPIVAEIVDVNTRNTIEENAALTALADFVVVNDLAARLIAGVACRRELGLVYDHLLGPGGQGIFVIPATMVLHRNEVRRRT